MSRNDGTTTRKIIARGLGPQKEKWLEAPDRALDRGTHWLGLSKVLFQSHEPPTWPSIKPSIAGLVEFEAYFCKSG